jgi:hypothetical protein
MNQDHLNLTVHVFTEFQPSFPIWCVQFAYAPAGWFRSRGDCPKAAFAAVWDSFLADQVNRLPAWLRVAAASAEVPAGPGERLRRPDPADETPKRSVSDSPALLSENFTR